MIPINDVERINKGDALYPHQWMLPFVVVGFTDKPYNSFLVRDTNTGGIINHISLFSKNKLDIERVPFEGLESAIKLVKPNNLARLEKGSIIIDREGVLDKGKNREWMVLIPAENKSYHMGMKKLMSASNYVLVPINKKTGKPMLESRGLGAREMHRILIYPQYGGLEGDPPVTFKVVMQKDDEGNLYMIDPTEHEAFRESLKWNNWER